VLALLEWGATHTRGSAPAVTHAGCGAPVKVEVRCTAGHEVAEGVVVGSRR
jgi:hypothetical protein